MRYFTKNSDVVLDETILFYFNGPLSQKVIEGVGDAIKDKLLCDDAEMGRIQKVFSLLVEQMQNVIRYSADRRWAENLDSEIAFGQITVGLDEDGNYFVSAGNRIHSADSHKLHRKISYIQQMSPEELRALYKEVRKKGPDADSKGAGLGFIEMARKSSERLDYAIEPIDETSSYFSMLVKA